MNKINHFYYCMALLGGMSDMIQAIYIFIGQGAGNNVDTLCALQISLRVNNSNFC